MSSHDWVLEDSYGDWERLPDGSIGNVGVFTWRCTTCGVSTSTQEKVPEGQTYKDVTVNRPPEGTVIHDLIDECSMEVVKRVHEL